MAAHAEPEYPGHVDHSDVRVPDHRLRVGCAMWANRAWVGRWFPIDTSPGRELESYVTWCTTVEGNTTFYAMPDAAAVARWTDQSPEWFRFCFKLPRSITHERRLRDCHDDLAAFLHRVEGLGPRMGPVQIQLPATFGPDDLGILDAFLTRLPQDLTWAVEVRHPDFFAGGASERPLDDLLAQVGANRVILDSRALFAAPAVTDAERDAHAAKPRVPVRPVATANEPLVRLIGQTDCDASLALWEPWFAKLAEWVDNGLRPHVFAHTPDNRDAPELARRIWREVSRRRELDGRHSALSPLPEPRRASEQLRLDGASDSP